MQATLHENSSDLQVPAPVTFTVPGLAKSERKRQRFVKGTGHVGKRTDIADRADWKAVVRLVAKEHFPEPLEGPICLRIEVRKPKPASWPKNSCKTNRWPSVWWKKPDVSNLAKPIEDALTGIAWHDDAQIVELVVHKSFGPQAETEVTVRKQALPEAVREAMKR